MKLGKPELIEQGQETRIRTLVEFEGRKEHLWYSVERRYADYLTTDKLDGFVVALLLPAMMANEDMHVDGPISEKLYWNLSHYYMCIMTSVNPALHPVRILPTDLDTGRQSPKPTGVGTGFSAGIDSFCVLADHYFDDVPDGYKITHLLFNNVGSHGRNGRKLFLDRYERLRPCVEELQIPILRVDSNLSDFHTVHFEQSHPPRNISVALLLQKLFGKYLYASTFKYEDCHVGPAKDAAHTDPVAIPLLSTETTECISAGVQYSRVEKTAKVAQLAQSHRYLDVCVNRQGQGNCGLCWKCARTLLTLELLGKISLYEKAFPLNRYRSKRRRCVAKVLAKDNPLTREILLLAKETHYRFPWDIRALATVRRVSTSLRNRMPWRRKPRSARQE